MMYTLGLLLTGLPFAVMLALGIALPMLGAVAFRSPAVGAWAILLVYFLDAVARSGIAVNLGFNLFLPDIVLGLLFVVALARILFVDQARRGVSPMALFAAVVAVNLAHGLVVFKLAAGVGVRPTFYALSAAAYMASFRLEATDLSRIARALAVCAVGLALLASFRLLVVAFDIRELLPPTGSFQPRGHSIWRVIVSDETLLLAEIALTLWYFAPPVRLAGWRWLALPLLMLVVVLQHRSVWLATMVGVGAVMVGRTHDGSGWRRSGALLLVLAVLVGGARLGLGDTGIGADMTQSAVDAIELRGTADERLGSWRQLIKNWAGGGPKQWLVGVPFGTSLERYTGDELGARRIGYQPHNYLVEVLVTQGIVGALGFLWMMAASLRGLWRGRTLADDGPRFQWLLVMLACQLAYYLTYGVSFVQALFLGLALSVVGHRPAALAPPGAAPAGAHGLGHLGRMPQQPPAAGGPSGPGPTRG